MSNKPFEIKGTGKKMTVTITLPFNADGQDSTSGKSLIHASTRGYVATDGGYSYSVNVIKKKD